MAATTLSAILTRFESVLTTAPLSLTLSQQPFSDETEPNAVVDTLVRVTSGGLAGLKSQSNYAEARLERVTVTLQQPLGFDGYGAQRALSDLADDVAKAIIADGPGHGYDVTEERGSRKQVNPKKTELCRLEIHFLVDYDWLES